MLIFSMMTDNDTARCQLEEIYELYSKDMWHTAYDILNDPHEAEDAVQTAFIKISEYLDEKIDVKCNKTRGLIVIIVRNTAINIYNKRKRRPTADIDELDGMLGDQSAADPELTVLRLDKSRSIALKLAQIKPEYADILSLKYVYEFTNNEIAEICGLSEVNVRVKLHRAKKALQDVLGGGFDD